VVVHEALDMVDLDVWLGGKSELIFVPVSTMVSCFSFWGPPEERRVLQDFIKCKLLKRRNPAKTSIPPQGKTPVPSQLARVAAP
jgi:hypothetical protein